MKFRLLHKGVAYVLSGLGLYALSLGGELSSSVLGLIGLAFCASWFAEAPLIERPGYVRGWTIVVVLVLGLQLVRAGGGASPFGLAVEFAAWLTLSRLFNRRTGAEYQQLAVLAFLHLIAGTVLTTSLSYGVLFVAFVVSTPWMLALTHLRVEIEANYPDEEKQGRAVHIHRVLSSRRIVGPAFLGWTAALSVPLFVSTIALFLLFPRVGFGFVSMGDRRGQAVAGFGDDVELGGFGVIRQDTTVVMRVTPRGDVPPDTLAGLFRLRGTAFDHYDGRRWTRTEGDRQRVASVGEHYPLRRMPQPGDSRVRIVLESLQEPVLFLPRGTVALRIPFVGTAGRSLARQVTRGGGYDLRYDARDDVGLVYEAFVSNDPTELALPAGTQNQFTRYLQLPARHDSLIARARELTADAVGPDEKISILLAYVRDSGRFTYSLDQVDPGGRPPLLAFLFGHRRGHCEYFASALALLLRAVGIPTRNVTGFLGAEYNNYGRYFSVRQGQAHSWVEVLLPSRGWVALDPTPASREQETAARAWGAGLRDMLDAVRTYWLMEVVGYDLRTQLGGLRKLGSWFRGLGLSGSSGTPTQPEARPEGGKRALWGVLVALVALGLLFWLLWRPRHRQRASDAQALSADAARARDLYLRLESVLARSGVKRSPACTPRAHALDLEAKGFRGAPTVQRVTEAYLEARFGGQPFSPHAARALTAEIESLRTLERR